MRRLSKHPDSWCFVRDDVMRTDTEIVWAHFRAAHPHLYHRDLRESIWWPFLAPKVRVR